MSNIVIRPDELGKTIQSMFDEYEDHVVKVVEDALPTVGKSAVKELKRTSPKRNGKYAKGWKSKIEKTRLGDRVVVYNKTSYQLTHLLEKGHAKVGVGGRVKAIPHIKPTEEKAVNETINLIEKGVRN